ncbi:MAG: M48 family metallopeptidase, partial [Candidatus Delongbacteria bacterium]|nr:M48 family metallopeptidase [Candidatus Delongbacteria bacterium]
WTSKLSIGKEIPKIVVKKMKTRWGSLSQSGILTINIELIKAPKECIDYVITHELCHLKYKDHSPKFYKLLESILPEWKKLKHKLELSLM